VVYTKNGKLWKPIIKNSDHNQASLQTVICSDTKADTSVTLMEVLVFFGKPMPIEIRRLEQTELLFDVSDGWSVHRWL
jgi:hypothetical protein